MVTKLSYWKMVHLELRQLVLIILKYLLTGAVKEPTIALNFASTEKIQFLKQNVTPLKL